MDFLLGNYSHIYLSITFFGAGWMPWKLPGERMLSIRKLKQTTPDRVCWTPTVLERENCPGWHPRNIKITEFHLLFLVSLWSWIIEKVVPRQKPGGCAGQFPSTIQRNKACFMADMYAHISCFPPKTPHKGSTSGDQSSFSIDTGKVCTKKKWSMALASVV